YSYAIPSAVLRAIVLHHLGQHDEAKKALADADRDLEESYRGTLDAAPPALIRFPEDLILREVIRREAHALIDGKPAADDRYRRLVRARARARMGREPEAETELAAARAARPDDPLVVAATARILAERGRQSQSQEAWSRASSLVDRDLAARPDDGALLRT